jgi:hypothetical protein
MNFFNYLRVELTGLEAIVVFGDFLRTEGQREIKIVFEDLISGLQHVLELLTIFESVSGLFVGDDD